MSRESMRAATRAAGMVRRKIQRACIRRVIVAVACCAGACVPELLLAQDSAVSVTSNAADSSCTGLSQPVGSAVDTIYGSLQATSDNRLPAAYIELMLHGIIDHFSVPAPLSVPVYGGPIHGSLSQPRGISKTSAPDSVTLTISGAVAFTVERDGRFAHTRLVSSSLSSSLDAHLVQAVIAFDSMHAVPPLPSGIPGDSVTFVFTPSNWLDSMSVSEPMFVATMPIWVMERNVRVTNAKPRPHYPTREERERIPGTVLLSFIVDDKGLARMNTTHLVRMTDWDFARAVLEVLPKWAFDPARIAGCPVMQLVQAPFEFRVPH